MGKKRIVKEKEKEIESDSDVESLAASESSADVETPAQKRIRLAKSYIAEINTAEELEKELRKRDGTWFVPMALYFTNFEFSTSMVKLKSTCTAVREFQDNIYIADLNGIYCYSKTKKQKSLISFVRNTLAMDLSFDGQYLIFGGKDKQITVWNCESNSIQHIFKQHRDTISALHFQNNSFNFYSASFDRSIKCFNASESSYTETLFGHQDRIAMIDVLSKERVLSCGMRDRTVRIFKIIEESQLLFRVSSGLSATEDLIVMEEMGETQKKRVKDSIKTGGSIDACCYIDDELFLSGSDAGCISLWSSSKKKPIYTRFQCHGANSKTLINGEEGIVLPEENALMQHDSKCGWITSLCAMPMSDLFVSGSGDGYIRVWSVNESKKSFQLINCIPAHGIINDLRFYKYDKRWYLLAAVGREMRFGRWYVQKDAKNSALIIDFGEVRE